MSQGTEPQGTEAQDTEPQGTESQPARPEPVHRTAIVTGSGRGIGAATAVGLARHGVDVVVNYLHDADSAESVRRRIVDDGGHAVVVQADASTADGAMQLREATLDEFGRLDIVVSNAGPLFRPLPIADMTWDDLDAIVTADLRCAFHTTKAVLPTMAAQGYGRLVYIGSMSARHPTRGLAHHSTARAAVTAFARAVAVETARQGITANVVAPGMVSTDRTAVAGGDYTARVAAITPVGRIATPDDVARAVRFFALDEDGFHTGTVLPVAGGLSA